MVMNGIYLVIASACILILAYRFYGAFIAAKVLTLDQYRPTPAMIHNDGHDYVPTNKWVTFGHHFAAIAGAGPLVGPVIAAQFGYLPGALWILIGSVLAGAVHDMVILFASVRYDGKSIADIAREEISKLAGFGAMLATLFLLVITLAGMAVVVANALHNSPWGFFSVFATIPIAIFIGIYLKWLRLANMLLGSHTTCKQLKFCLPCMASLQQHCQYGYCSLLVIIYLHTLKSVQLAPWLSVLSS